MSPEGHHRATVRLSAQPAAVASSVAGLRWTCHKPDAAPIVPGCARVISRHNHHTREAAQMHHAGPLF